MYLVSKGYPFIRLNERCRRVYRNVSFVNVSFAMCHSSMCQCVNVSFAMCHSQCVIRQYVNVSMRLDKMRIV